MGIGIEAAGGAKPRYGAAGLAFASQAVHLWVLAGEFAVRALSGTFVLLAAACQGVLAANLLFGPGRWTVRFGIVLNAGILLTWAITRFAGFPALFGFARLPVEAPNLAASAVEVLLLILLLRIGRELKAERGRRRVPQSTRAERIKEGTNASSSAR